MGPADAMGTISKAIIDRPAAGAIQRMNRTSVAFFFRLPMPGPGRWSERTPVPQLRAALLGAGAGAVRGERPAVARHEAVEVSPVHGEELLQGNRERGARAREDADRSE